MKKLIKLLLIIIIFCSSSPKAYAESENIQRSEIKDNIDEFIEEHPYSVIVNYDIADKFDCGKTFRTNTKTLEDFKKDKGTNGGATKGT